MAPKIPRGCPPELRRLMFRPPRRHLILRPKPDQTVLDLAHNLFVGTRLSDLTAEGQLPGHVEQLLLRMSGRIRRPRDSEGYVRLLVTYLRSNPRLRTPASPPAALVSNLTALGEALGLSDLERRIVQCLFLLLTDTNLQGLSGLIGELTLHEATQTLAVAIGARRQDVAAALVPRARLASSGLIELAEGPSSLVTKFQLSLRLVDLLSEPGLTPARLLAHFLELAPDPGLTSADFDHLPQLPTTQALLAAALRARTPGINILLYGATGTGKTELARLLAHSLGVPLHCASGAQADGSHRPASDRLDALRLGNQLLKPGTSLLLFDELEDVFGPDANPRLRGHRRTCFGKQWFNHLLETNRLPVLWISNDVSEVDPAMLRRFTYAIEFRPLGIHQRARVLSRHLGTSHRLDPTEVQTLAERFEASPAQLGSAVAVGRLLYPEEGPDRHSLEAVLRPSVQLVTGEDPGRRPAFEVRGYRPAAVNCHQDLGALADRLSAWRPGAGPGLTLCLYGPSGTGKTEYVRYLAHRMERPVVHKRPSDLLSKWVGGTERALADAFREAEESDAVLLLDEVDGLLLDRRGGSQSWEVSQVTELLQQLETFRGVVACTTNLWKELDEASLRRFMFKLEFRYLRPDQSAALFRARLEPLCADGDDATDEALEAALSPLTTLTPGDFAAIRRQVMASDGTRRWVELVDLLAGEARLKGGQARPVGFLQVTSDRPRPESMLARVEERQPEPEPHRMVCSQREQRSV